MENNKSLEEIVKQDGPILLSEKLAAIMHAIGSVPKTKKEGSTVSYAYRSIDDVMNALNPRLAQHGITMRLHIISHELKRVETTKGTGTSAYIKVSHIAIIHLGLTFSDGYTTETTEEIAMSEDFSDKAYTQAMSMAFKYAITRKFCIPTEDLEDPDGKSLKHEEPVKAAKEQAAPTPKAEAKATVNTKVPPAPKPKKPIAEMDKDGKEMTKEWANTVKALSNGKVGIDKVKEVYALTPEQEEKLIKLIPKNPVENE